MEQNAKPVAASREAVKFSPPLFALVRHPDNPTRAMICKLEDDGATNTYAMIAEGEWLALKDGIDYLHAGEEYLHGP